MVLLIIITNYFISLKQIINYFYFKIYNMDYYQFIYELCTIYYHFLNKINLLISIFPSNYELYLPFLILLKRTKFKVKEN